MEPQPEMPAFNDFNDTSAGPYLSDSDDDSEIAGHDAPDGPLLSGDPPPRDLHTTALRALPAGGLCTCPQPSMAAAYFKDFDDLADPHYVLSAANTFDTFGNCE
eukprot:gene26396-32378_t